MPKKGMEPIRRTEAINATLECICGVGIDAITLDMVAKTAGFSKGILSYYFKNKHELVIESVRAFFDASTRRSRTMFGGISPRQMLKVVVDLALPVLPRHGDEQRKFNISDNLHEIVLPEGKLDNLMYQIISKVPFDEQYRQIICEVFSQELEGTAEIMSLISSNKAGDSDRSNRIACEFLSVLYGLSFFRMNGFKIGGISDYREIALDYIRTHFADDTAVKQNLE